MIPTTADDRLMSIYVQNIVDQWNDATDQQMTAGRSWYRVAHDLATLLAGDAHRGAGVLAALSPQTAWEYNVDLATRAFSAGKATGHLGDALRKAQRIMNGEDPMIVLPRDSKTWNFYRCIADPDDHEPVVIDRHAHDVAVGTKYGSEDRGLSAKRRYATLARAYRLAAEKLGETPSVVQAVTWVVWREANGS